MTIVTILTKVTIMMTLTNLTTVTVDEHGVPVMPNMTVAVDKTPTQIVQVVRDNPNSADYPDIYYKIGLGDYIGQTDSAYDTVILYRTVNDDGTVSNSVAVEFAQPVRPA